MTARQNFVTGQGETFDLNVQYLDSNGTPVDFTGHSVDFVLKKAGSGEVINTYPATTDTQGNIVVKVDDATTLLWPTGKSAYVLVHTDPLGDERWLAYGALTVVTGADV